MKCSQVRKYSESDWSAVASLLADLHHHVAELDVLGQFLGREDFDKEAYLKYQLEQIDSKGGKMYVAVELEESNERIVGVVFGWVNHVDESSLEYVSRISGFISELYVEEGSRGAGFGKALIEAMESYFEDQKCEHIAISYLMANKKAAQFYEKMGYQGYSVRVVKNTRKC
jgi:GNAT superfamily N-acetyltransferase